MLHKLRELIGYPYGDGDTGGTVTPGTSVGNIMAVNLALQKKFPDFKEKGVVGGRVPKFAIFVSLAASSSFEKAQLLEGKLTPNFSNYL